VPGAVDEHRVVVVNAADDVIAVNDRLVAALLFQTQRCEDGGSGLAHIGL